MKALSPTLAMVVLAACLGAAPVMAADVPGAGSDAGKTIIYRDTWGVPHIYAPTVEAGFYAMGQAQAEDRPEQLLWNFMYAMGERASFDGPGAIESDVVSRMFDHYGVAKRNYDRVRPDVQGHLTAYVNGVNDFFAQHPGDVPEWWGDRKVDEHMVIAFGRIFLYSWSIDDALDDLKRGGVEPGFDEVERASNQWAVAPSRSAEGAAILCIDPHLSWFGPSRFWEFRIHAGELEGSGFTLAGFPCIGLGHNADLAWAMTTGGPDTADIFELTLNPDNPLQYKYDDEWRDLVPRPITLKVRGQDDKEITLYDSHHGPICALRNGKAYAAKTAYADAVEGNEAWYEFNFAKDFRGAIRAMDTLQVFPQNVMVADTSGNIYYQRTGCVPRRPDGYDWTRPVDGSTSATEWQGFHPSMDHVQVTNPPQGFMQNCNIDPSVMMPDAPFDLENMPYYLTMAKPGSPPNQRGARALELLGADDSVTAEEAIAYATDVHPYGVDRWLEVLRGAHTAAGVQLGQNSRYRVGMRIMEEWDARLTRDSQGALCYYYWRKQMVEDYGRDGMGGVARRIDDPMASLGEEPKPIELTGVELGYAAASFARAMDKMEADLGNLNGVYGDVFRAGRDDTSHPVGGGGDGHLGTTTFRNVNYHGERPDHTRWGRSGQTSTQIVVLSKPIRSWTAPPIGQSDRPDSPHYLDQAENLFGPRKMKPTWWMPEDLVGHIESRTELAPRL